MHLATWWIFVTTEIALCLTPGPAVLFVLSSALRYGARSSLQSNLGILAANSVYYLLSATGVGALLLASYNLFFAVKWLGAAYLIFLGIRTFLNRSFVLEVPGGPCVGTPGSRAKLFRDAFLVQMSNPKAIVFFVALLPQFINPRGPVGLQIAILGVTSVVIEFCVLLGYGLLAARASAVARQPRYASWTNRISGTLLIGAGAGMATLRRS